MGTRRPGPYAPRVPSLEEVQRATALWTPGSWEMWGEQSTRSGRSVHLVAVDGKPLLYALEESDAAIAAAAPNLYRAVLGLLHFFDAGENGDYVFVGNTGVRVHVPRHLRSTIPDTLRALAKARGKRWW